MTTEYAIYRIRRVFAEVQVDEELGVVRVTRVVTRSRPAGS